MPTTTTIHILPESLANKISAGEVVERPASVVKELIENAIDAEATRIQINITAAGLQQIRVVDDGYGMSESDLSLSIIRHATSKIACDDDLAAINTLGFRGEALPSIAAVSHMTISSRQIYNDSGASITAVGGLIKKTEEVGVAPGTSVQVTRLFYNTPVRKEFLRAVSAENAAISEIVTRYALSHPSIAFSLTSDNRLVFQSGGQNRRLDVITDIYGSDIARQMFEVHAEDIENQYSLSGHLAPPGINRGNRKHITIFINGRWVKSPLLDEAVIQGYDTLLPIHRYPVCILNIQVNPREIDVNVHPTKMEVRFHHEVVIHDFISNAVKKTLLSHTLSPEVHKGIVQPKTPHPIQNALVFQNRNRTLGDHFEIQSKGPVRETSYLIDSDHQNRGELLQETENQDLELISDVHETVNELNILGQIFNTYILIAASAEMLIVDQHAAQERVLFETLLKNMNIKIAAQQLLLPYYIDLTPAESEILAEYEESLRAVGFDFERASGRSLSLRGLPAGISLNNASNIFHAILEDIGISRSKKKYRQDHIDTIIRAACRASVKANDFMTHTEMKALLTQLLDSDNPYTCPHGRPTILRFTKLELEKMFKRV